MVILFSVFQILVVSLVDWIVKFVNVLWLVEMIPMLHKVLAVSKISLRDFLSILPVLPISFHLIFNVYDFILLKQECV